MIARRDSHGHDNPTTDNSVARPARSIGPATYLANALNQYDDVYLEGPVRVRLSHDLGP